MNEPVVVDPEQVVAALVIEPGDHLLVCVSSAQITHEQVARMREQLMNRLPELSNVTIIAGATALAAYRDPKPYTPDTTSF